MMIFLIVMMGTGHYVGVSPEEVHPKGAFGLASFRWDESKKCPDEFLSLRVSQDFNPLVDPVALNTGPVPDNNRLVFPQL